MSYMLTIKGLREKLEIERVRIAFQLQFIQGEKRKELLELNEELNNVEKKIDIVEKMIGA